MIPAGFARVAGWLLRLVPEGVLLRILPGRMRYDRLALPIASAEKDRVNVLVAPMNYAGQGRQWARAVTEHVTGVSAANLAVRMPTGFAFPADVTVPVAAYAISRSWHRRQKSAVLSGFQYVIVEAERQPLGNIYAESVAAQVRDLGSRGVSVAMLCHGSDIRLPSRHAADEPDSPFVSGLMASTPQLERQAARNRRLLDSLGLPVFVSTPGLLDDVPYATWLPVVVDGSVWSSGVRVLERAVPIVAHAPSSGAIKGSDLIDPMLRKLESDGMIEYLRIEGVPSAEMPEFYGRADIVLDQFRIGDYGVAACEALALGRVVIGHVSERVRRAVRDATTLELPIIESSAAALVETLRDVLAHRDVYRKLAQDGPRFVAEVHDGRRSADALRSFLAGR